MWHFEEEPLLFPFLSSTKRADSGGEKDGSKGAGRSGAETLGARRGWVGLL